MFSFERWAAHRSTWRYSLLSSYQGVQEGGGGHVHTQIIERSSCHLTKEAVSVDVCQRMQLSPAGMLASKSSNSNNAMCVCAVL